MEGESKGFARQALVVGIWDFLGGSWSVDINI